MTQFFTERGAWFGGYYELAIELGPRSDERLLSGLAAVWSRPDLEGVYLDRDLEPAQQRRHAVTSRSIQADHLLGLARLPNDVVVACGTCVIREDDGPDWLDLYLPMGSLATAYQVSGSPFDPEAIGPDEGRGILDTWLAAIGAAVYNHVSYRLALVGFEASGMAYADDVIRNGIPPRRGWGYLWPTGDGVTFYPRTE
jgi:hypothetical protein